MSHDITYRSVAHHAQVDDVVFSIQFGPLRYEQVDVHAVRSRYAALEETKLPYVQALYYHDVLVETSMLGSAFTSPTFSALRYVYQAIARTYLRVLTQRYVSDPVPVSNHPMFLSSLLELAEYVGERFNQRVPVYPPGISRDAKLHLLLYGILGNAPIAKYRLQVEEQVVYVSRHLFAHPVTRLPQVMTRMQFRLNLEETPAHARHSVTRDVTETAYQPPGECASDVDIMTYADGRIALYEDVGSLTYLSRKHDQVRRH